MIKNILYSSILIICFCFTSAYAVKNKCHTCSEDITGSYIEFENKYYHDNCYDKNIALKCDLCRNNISGDYLIDYLGNNYCQSHKDVDPQCEFCLSFFGAPTNEGGYEYSDGRKICTLCEKNAITNNKELSKLTGEINAHLAMLGLEIPVDRISLKLTDRKNLLQISSNSNKNLLGYTFYQEKSSFFGFGKKQTLTVYILEGMPRMWTIEALAHELNHVWQFLKSGEEKESAFCEGSANYAAFLVLQNYDNKFSEILIDNLLKNEDPDYGEGFRRVKSLVENNSREFWINYLSQNETFPEGY